MMAGIEVDDLRQLNDLTSGQRGNKLQCRHGGGEHGQNAPGGLI